MSRSDTIPPHRTPDTQLSRAERSSLTHGDFWIPEEEREKYKRALKTLNEAGVPYVVTGAYAIYEYTGIYRETKDLDLFVEPKHLLDAVRSLRDSGFRTRLEQPHWLAKAKLGEHFVDLIFGMGNGIALVDEDWYRHSRPAILAAHPVRVAPAEDLIWHRLFIGERHRQDMADIQHLILALGPTLDWKRLLERTGEHWPLLLAQLQIFSYVYPELPGGVPAWVLEELVGRAAAELERERSGERVTQGTLISRFSFAIDVNEWGFRDLRTERVREMERSEVVRSAAFADVWDERSESVEEYRKRYGASGGVAEAPP
jgi:hypothetical protein